MYSPSRARFVFSEPCHTLKLPALNDLRHLIEVVKCTEDDVAGIFGARPVLALRYKTDAWAKPCDAWVVQPKSQYRVQLRHNGMEEACTALFLRPGANVELLEGGKISQAVPFAPLGQDKWIVLEAEPGYCWIDGYYEDRQFQNGRSSSATLPVRHAPESITLPWNSAEEYSWMVESKTCSPGDLLGLIATNDHERAVMLTDFERSACDGGRCESSDPVYRQFSVERGDGTGPNACKAIWIRAGAAAELLTKGSLQHARIFGPMPGERSVMLEAPFGHCWVAGNLLPAQYTDRWDM